MPCRDTLLSNSIYKQKEGKMEGEVDIYREIMLAQLMGEKVTVTR